MNRLILFLALLMVILGNENSFAKTNPDLELLRNKVKAELMIPAVDESSVRELIATMLPDGTWPGINYVDVSRTGFQHGNHLGNMVEMGRAYEKKGTRLKGDAKLKKAIYASLDYWLANDFICENWWWNQIGTPNQLISLLLIMDTDLTKEQIAKTLPMIGRAHLTASGARPSGDRIKIAGILAKTLLFNRDEVQFGEVIKVIEGEIKFSTGQRGMQQDYSFHHREDRVNNTLSYGLGYADAFAEWAAFVAGTKYQFSEKPLQQLIDYYLDGICKQMVYGKYDDPGTKNRDISRQERHQAMSTKTPERLLQTTDYRRNELQEIVKIRKGEVAPTLSHSTFFWQTEHFSFQRPDFFTSVRMHSTRNRNMEEPYNGEGLMNHHRGDGSNYISRTGSEYSNTAPVYDWQKIPGTTVVQKPELPSEKEIQKRGLTDFVGAATDGKYGVAVFDFKSPHDPLEAKKSWFFFEKEYVCLGAGINSSSPFPVATTINQCALKGAVTVGSSNQSAEQAKGSHELKNVQWIFHDGIAYLFPEPANLIVSNQEETGSWYKINHQSDTPKEEVKNEVLKIWFDHGANPKNAQYQYVIVPSATAQELKNHPDRQIVILANSADIQAVKHTGLNISELVFYKSGQIQISDNLKIDMDSPGLAIVKSNGANLKAITVADPSRKLSRIHLTVNARIEKKGANFSAWWNNEKEISEISIDLPQNVYAGRSVTIDF